MLLRFLQEEERMGMPHAEALPVIGSRRGALRVRDAKQNWRIIYRVDADAIVILEVYAKKTRQIPDAVLKRCQRRCQQYDAAWKRRRKRSEGETDG